MKRALRAIGQPFQTIGARRIQVLVAMQSRQNVATSARVTVSLPGRGPPTSDLRGMQRPKRPGRLVAQSDSAYEGPIGRAPAGERIDSVVICVAYLDVAQLHDGTEYDTPDSLLRHNEEHVPRSVGHEGS